MNYRTFLIRHFKGIDKATLDLRPRGAGIFAIIGLNESGKTTIFEALSTFEFGDEPTGALFAAAGDKSKRITFIPKHRKANYTGEIGIVATVDFDPGEKEIMDAELQQVHPYSLVLDSIPD